MVIKTILWLSISTGVPFTVCNPEAIDIDAHGADQLLLVCLVIVWFG